MTPETTPLTPPARTAPRGFTLVELLVVILILGILIGLLVPAIIGAKNKANESAVTSEIGLLTNAIGAFKERYGDVPPSRVLLVENGNYTPFLTDTSVVTQYGAAQDITYAQLAQRSLRYLRKFFPQVKFNTTVNAAAGFYDFNGDGTVNDASGNPQVYYLDGGEALVFFLGGIPSTSGTTLSGFAKNPTNPFRNDSTDPTIGTSNRIPPDFEFKAERLADLDGDTMPDYGDFLSRPGDIRPYAYFSAYGQNGYDPNDVNDFTGAEDSSVFLNFGVQFPTSAGTNLAQSVAPNPYTNGAAFTAGRATAYLNANSYQIISPGRDRVFGLGGAYDAASTSLRLPDNGVAPRAAERDNLSNFTSGSLE